VLGKYCALYARTAVAFANRWALLEVNFTPELDRCLPVS
jgi:hypothetical protein